MFLLPTSPTEDRSPGCRVVCFPPCFLPGCSSQPSVTCSLQVLTIRFLLHPLITPALCTPSHYPHSQSNLLSRGSLPKLTPLYPVPLPPWIGTPYLGSHETLQCLSRAYPSLQGFVYVAASALQTTGYWGTEVCPTTSMFLALNTQQLSNTCLLNELIN